MKLKYIQQVPMMNPLKIPPLILSILKFHTGVFVEFVVPCLQMLKMSVVDCLTIALPWDHLFSEPTGHALVEEQVIQIN